MLVSVTLNPCVDHALFVEKLTIGDTNRVMRVEKDAGGKGINVSRVFAELGGDTAATGFLGGATASYIRHVLQVEGVEDAFVNIQGETRTNFSVEDDSGTPPTTLNSRGPNITEKEWNQLLTDCKELARGARWAALGGSLPPGVPDEAFQILGELFHAARVQVILDADGIAQRHGMLAQPDFVKPNAAEASRLLKTKIESDLEAVEAVLNLHADLGGGKKIAVISRGKDGAVMATDGGVWVGRAPKVHSTSTIGSGDSMIAGILWAIDTGKSPADALRWGLASGAATAMTDGSGIARLPMIQDLYDESSIESKLA
jgi:1-phosphofructokinase